MELPELEKVKLYHALAYIEGDLGLLQQLLKQRLKSFEQIENNIKKAGREDISVQLDDILRDLNLQHLIDYIFDNKSAHLEDGMTTLCMILDLVNKGNETVTLSATTLCLNLKLFPDLCISYMINRTSPISYSPHYNLTLSDNMKALSQMFENMPLKYILYPKTQNATLPENLLANSLSTASRLFNEIIIYVGTDNSIIQDFLRNLHDHHDLRTNK
jgi:hypothetical protein